MSFTLAGLNYRKLTDESSDPLATLQPVLTSQNVLSISKLANRLPLPGGGGGATVSASAVHAVWLQKVFWKGDPQLLKRPPQSDQDYLHAYDTCAKYLDRLAPGDAVRFLDDITFSLDASKNVSLNWTKQRGIFFIEIILWRGRGSFEQKRLYFLLLSQVGAVIGRRLWLIAAQKVVGFFRKGRIRIWLKGRLRGFSLTTSNCHFPHSSPLTHHRRAGLL